MHVNDVAKSFSSIVRHEDFPRNIEEMSILLDILRLIDKDSEETLTTGGGLTFDENGELKISNNSQIYKALNRIGGSTSKERNADFEYEKGSVEEKFINELTIANRGLNKERLHSIELCDLYDKDVLNSYNDYGEWAFYHENYKNNEATGMDELTRACYE